MPLTFIDLEQVVKDWAWRLYDRTATRKQRALREKERKKSQTYLALTIDWTDCKFKDETVWTRLADDDFDKEGGKKATGEDEPVPASARKVQPSHTQSSDVSVLFQTKFTNNTRETQEYSLRTEKTTSSTCSTEVESGYTKGFELGVSLKCPGDIMEANAGYHREFSLSNTDGETFEETLTWGVESIIKVKAEHIAEAELVVKEKKQSGDFSIETKVRGMVYVTFTNVRDNNSFVKSTGGDIYDIVDQFLERERRKGEPMAFIELKKPHRDPPYILIRTKGSCKFRFGIQQEVKVNQRPTNSGY